MFRPNRNERNVAMKSLSPSLVGRRRRREKPLLFLLGATVLLLSFSALVRSDEGVNVNEAIDDVKESNDGGGTIGTSTSREETIYAEDGMQQQAPMTFSRTTKAMGVQLMEPTYNLPSLLASPRSNSRRNRIWIILASRQSCKQSSELLYKLRTHILPKIELGAYIHKANGDLDDNDSNTENVLPEIKFVTLPIDDKDDNLNQQILQRLGIARLPSLLFLWDEEDPEGGEGFPFQLETIMATSEIYKGRSESIPDLVDGLNHYLTRLVLRSSSPSHSKPRNPPKSMDQAQYDNRDLPLTAIRLESFHELQNIVRKGASNKVSFFQQPQLPLDTELSEEDDEWIRYLMDDENLGRARSLGPENDDKKDSQERRIQDSIALAKRAFRVAVQCRSNVDIEEEEDSEISAKSTTQESKPLQSPIESYRKFDQAVRLLGARRDVLFAVFEGGGKGRGTSGSTFSSFCIDDKANSDDGRVRVWDVQPSDDLLVNERHADNEFISIIDGLSVQLRPDILWFDRRMTAPIAFHPRYRRHAVLFVDLHDRTSSSSTRDAIRTFRHECQKLNLEHQDLDLGVVCMIVPSTEVRVLNTFGIDIYSHLDREATEKIRATICHGRELMGIVDDNGPDSHFCESITSDRRPKGSQNTESMFSSVLPTLLVTERQANGSSIERHYLDPPINQASLTQFFDDFVHGRTKPERKSGRVFTEEKCSDSEEDCGVPKSKHSIYLPSANSLQDFLKANREKHVLIQLYAPTCGHCKRFNIIWNSLGTLIDFLGWSNRLVLARIDVTSNEIFVPGMVAKWLPDLFYFGVGVDENPIHYDATPLADEFELGGISDPLELLEWWMDEAGETINESELLHSLEGTAMT